MTNLSTDTKAPECGVPAPDDCLFLELLKAIAYLVGERARSLDEQSQCLLDDIGY